MAEFGILDSITSIFTCSMLHMVAKKGGSERGKFRSFYCPLRHWLIIPNYFKASLG